jgi:hypothetical protein
MRIEASTPDMGRRARKAEKVFMNAMVEKVVE